MKRTLPTLTEQQRAGLVTTLTNAIIQAYNASGRISMSIKAKRKAS